MLALMDDASVSEPFAVKWVDYHNTAIEFGFIPISKSNSQLYNICKEKKKEKMSVKDHQSGN